MIEIRIEKYDSPIHCIKCGKETVSSVSNFINKDSISICKHLVYLGKGGGFDENSPEYCKFYDELMQVGAKDFLQILREELDDEHLILNFTTSTNLLSRFFVVYNLGDLSKEKSYFNNDKNCKNWDVWGPTIEAVERKQIRTTMREIHTTNYDTPIYCMICGTQTTDAKGSVVECPHLVYFGMEEGSEFSIYDDVEEPDDDDEWIQYDAQLKEFRKKLDYQHLCIHVDVPAPSFATFSIIYNLNANLKNTKNQQDSNKTDWRETGEW
jgi:hypothetical protein